MSVGAVNKQTGDRIPTAGMPAIDSVLSGSSTNPVQNAVITAALDEKADTDIVASDFDATASYTAGNYCIYEGKFYRFKNNHSGAWSASDVEEVKIAGELSSIKSGLINVVDNVKLNTNDLTTPSRTKNLLPMKLSDIKAANTTGTWSGNSYTINDVTFTVQTDGDGNVTGVIANGTASDIASFVVYPTTASSFNGMILNGCPVNGSATSYKIQLYDANAQMGYDDLGAGVTINASNGSSVRVLLGVANGCNADNVVFYPMLRLATENATFAPYIQSVESRLKALEMALAQIANS